MTIYIKKMSLRGQTTEGGPSELIIFEDAAGKPIRTEGSKVDLSPLFESFDCLAAEGTKVTLQDGQTYSGGIDAAGNVIAEVQATNEETGETETICPLDEQTAPPIPLVPVADGTYKDLYVTFAGYASMKGCFSRYFRETNTKTQPNTS